MENVRYPNVASGRADRAGDFTIGWWSHRPEWREVRLENGRLAGTIRFSPATKSWFFNNSEQEWQDPMSAAQALADRFCCQPAQTHLKGDIS